MSNIFEKQLLKDLFSENSSDVSLKLPQYLSVVNNKVNNTIESFLPKKQNGGGLNLSISNEEDVNQLISMLTSESSDNNASTETAVIENRLKGMLQNGGANLKKRTGGGNPYELKKAIELLQRTSYKINGGGDSNMFIPNNSIQKENTSSESSILNKMLRKTNGSETSPFQANTLVNNLSATSIDNSSPAKVSVPNELFIPSIPEKKSSDATSSEQPNIKTNEL